LTEGRIKKEELRFLRSFDDRHEDGGQFVAFLAQRRQLVGWDNLCVDQELEPVAGLFNLAETFTALRNELGLAPAAAAPVAAVYDRRARVCVGAAWLCPASAPP
jgi:hypothetical protein